MFTEPECPSVRPSLVHPLGGKENALRISQVPVALYLTHYSATCHFFYYYLLYSLVPWPRNKP